jgi:hypothetical protein
MFPVRYELGSYIPEDGILQKTERCIVPRTVAVRQKWTLYTGTLVNLSKCQGNVSVNRVCYQLSDCSLSSVSSFALHADAINFGLGLAQI